MKNLAIAALLVGFTLTACNEGPAEELGESIDNATTDLGNAVEDACEDVSNRNC